MGWGDPGQCLGAWRTESSSKGHIPSRSGATLSRVIPLRRRLFPARHFGSSTAHARRPGVGGRRPRTPRSSSASSCVSTAAPVRTWHTDPPGRGDRDGQMLRRPGTPWSSGASSCYRRRRLPRRARGGSGSSPLTPSSRALGGGGAIWGRGGELPRAGLGAWRRAPPLTIARG